ncbi:hypothetical protein RJ641_002584, partial [Dillenia turbinata]
RFVLQNVVLKGFSDGLSRGKKHEEMQKLATDLWSANMRHPDPSEVINKDIISHFVLRLVYCRTEDLRKWFLANEIALFRNRFNWESAEVQILMVLDVQSDATEGSDNAKEKLSQVARSINQPLPGTDTTIFKVPFEEVPDLVAGRRVYIHKGHAYIAMNQALCQSYQHFNNFDQVVSLLVTKFCSHLSRALVLTNRKWTSTVKGQEKDRLSPGITVIFFLQIQFKFPIVIHLFCLLLLLHILRCPSFLNHCCFCAAKRRSPFKTWQKNAIRSLPEVRVCIFLMHCAFITDVQLDMLLNQHVGPKLNDALAFWKAEGIVLSSSKLRVGWVGIERFDKEYAYSISRLYTLFLSKGYIIDSWGWRSTWMPILTLQLHVNPILALSEDNLRAALHKMGVSSRAMEDIMDKFHIQKSMRLPFSIILVGSLYCLLLVSGRGGGPKTVFLIKGIAILGTTVGNYAMRFKKNNNVLGTPQHHVSPRQRDDKR